MSRKNKIIVSVVGITIVLLALLGLTYAYYLTRIQGNTNTNSISVTTADLRLVYRDGSANVVETEIEPSNEVYTKEFTVTNEGNVNIDYGVYLIDVINTFVRKDDIKYTMECSTDGTEPCGKVETATTFPSGISELSTATIEPKKTHTYTFKFTYKDTGTDQSVDMGKELSAKIQIFGKNNNGLIIPYETNTLAYNILNNASNEKNGTKLLNTPLSNPTNEITYKSGEYTTETVSAKESMLFAWKIGDSESAAESGKDVNSFEEAVGKYVYNWDLGWTKYLESYDSESSTLTFIVEVIAVESLISIAEDDFGTSYYYRGAVENNYVNFAGMCWRVVRIQGDGSVKLILEDQYTTCDDDETSGTDTIKFTGAWNIPTTTGGTTRTGNFGYNDTKVSNKRFADYLNPTANSASTSMSTAFKNFQEDVLDDYIEDLKPGGWCYADDAYRTEQVDLSTTQPLTESEKEAIYRRGTWNENYWVWENVEYMYYDSYVRLFGNTTKTPTLKCNGTTMNTFGDNTTEMYVGTLTADEIVYAGDYDFYDNEDSYLINDYQKDENLQWGTLSPVYLDAEIGADHALVAGESGGFYHWQVSDEPSLRPAVSLASSAVITDGVGTIDDPYIIN